MPELSEGSDVYLPDGSKGEVLSVSTRYDGTVNGALVLFWDADGTERQDWFDPEDLNTLSVNERLRRLEKRLGIDE
jgi:hypothetical protein